MLQPRLSLAATAPGSWQNSTTAVGKNSPVLNAGEPRGSSHPLSSQLNYWLSTPLGGNYVAHTRPPHAADSHDRGSSNYSFHVKWAHNKTKTLDSSQGHCGSTKGFFPLRLLILCRDCLKATSSSPWSESRFLFGQGAHAVLSSLRTTWPLCKSPYPELTTQSELFSAPDIWFMPVFWLSPHNVIHATVDIGQMVDWISKQLELEAGENGCSNLQLPPVTSCLCVANHNTARAVRKTIPIS